MNENQELTQEQIDAVKKTQEIYQSWPLTQKTPQEQKEILKKQISSDIVATSLAKDLIEEIYVIEDLQPVVAQVLQELTLPDDYPIDAEVNLPREVVSEQFEAYCKSILVRPTSIAQLVDPAPTPEEQFIRYITKNRKKVLFLNWWGQNLNLVQYYQENGVPFRPSIEHLETMFHMHAMLECVGRKQAEEMAAMQNQAKLQMATAGSMEFGR